VLTDFELRPIFRRPTDLLSPVLFPNDRALFPNDSPEHRPVDQRPRCKGSRLSMTQAPAPTRAAAPEAAAPAKKKLLSGKQIKIVLIVVGVMALPAAGAALLLPKGHAASTTEQSAEGASHAEEAHPQKSDNVVEVEVGSFSVSVEPDDAQMWNVSFKLFATIASESQSHFGDASEKYKARLRQAVVKVVRMSSIKDLRDPQLELMKREMKSQLNNVLPEPYIQEVVVSEIRVMQQ
jgi:flagellar basal body-associated protein FliL